MKRESQSHVKQFDMLKHIQYIKSSTRQKERRTDETSMEAQFGKSDEKKLSREAFSK